MQTSLHANSTPAKTAPSAYLAGWSNFCFALTTGCLCTVHCIMLLGNKLDTNKGNNSVKNDGARRKMFKHRQQQMIAMPDS